MTANWQDKYQKFWFEAVDYRLDQGKLIVELKYSLDKSVFFTERLVLPREFAGRVGRETPAFKRALQALHIVGGISYYKTFLPKKMAGVSLSQEQTVFWKKVYERGLGEFFYRNKIDFRGLINFPVFREEVVAKAEMGREEEVPDGPAPGVVTGGIAVREIDVREKLSGGNLVAIGGGKDSIVTAELLKENGIDFNLFSLRDSAPVKTTSQVVGKERLLVERQLDPALFELNEKGALNGHVPITAYISFLMVLCSTYYGFDKVIMSLEKSANFGQTMYLGMDINHQYSKSEEFEEDLRRYIRSHIDGEIEYFSLLRGFNELKIAKLFSGLENFDLYAPIFTSCNANFKIHKEKSPTLWCGECPKCAFVFLILAPFVPKSKLLAIFGDNLLEKPELKNLFEEILGVRSIKPFECVGTPEESQAALWLISQKAEYKNDFLIQHFQQEILPKLNVKDWLEMIESTMAMSNQHHIPESFLKILKKYAD